MVHFGLVHSLFAYPNPFTNEVMVPYDTEMPNASLKLTIYNAQGKLIRTIEKQQRIPGHYELTWDGLSSQGISASAGIYLLMLIGDNVERNCRIIKSK